MLTAMKAVEQDDRRRSRRRITPRVAALATLGLAAVAALVIGLVLVGKPIVEQRASPAGTPAVVIGGAPIAAGNPWQVARDEVIAAPYYWVTDGERVDRWPQLSPDGTKVAYLPTANSKATDLGRIVVRDLAAGTERDLTSEEGYSYTSVRWSPNGRSLAFVKYRPEQDRASPAEVWRIDADGGNRSLLYRLETPPDMRGPALGILRWSADGRYVETHGTIWGGGGGTKRVRADGSGAEDVVYPTSAQFGVGEGALVGGTVFSPTGDYALHVAETAGLLNRPEGAPESGHSLVLYDLRAGRSRVLGSFAGVAYLTQSGISPDGNWIAFQTVVFPPSGPPREPARLWVVRRDGTGLREVATEEYQLVQGGGLLWSAVGRAYFVGLPGDSANRDVGYLYELDAASGVARVVRTDWQVTNPVSASRDGRRLLVIRGGWDKAELRLLELAPQGTRPQDRSVPTPTEPLAASIGHVPRFGAPRDLPQLPPSNPDWRVSPDGQWVS